MGDDFVDFEPDDLPVATVRRLTGAVAAGATVAAVGVVFGTAGPDVWAETELFPSMARHTAAPTENLATARVVLLWGGLLWGGIVDSDWFGDRKQVIAMVLSNLLLGDAARQVSLTE